MAKIDLGIINTCITYSGDITVGTNIVGDLPIGSWVCVPVYPLNLDIVCSSNSNNQLVIVSKNYSGAVVVACYNIN